MTQQERLDRVQERYDHEDEGGDEDFSEDEYEPDYDVFEEY